MVVAGDALLRRLADVGKAKRAGGWQFIVKDGCFRHPGGGLALVFGVRPAKVFAHAKGDPLPGGPGPAVPAGPARHGPENLPHVFEMTWENDGRATFS